MDDNSIKVLVRVRPLLPREVTKEPQQSLVSMPPKDPTKTILRIPPNTKIRTEQENGRKVYNFDESVWSFNKEDSNYVDNKQFYIKTGSSLVEHLFSGFNVCLLAYGQTSSGKTFTMTGTEEEPGVIPLMVRDVLRQREILVNQKINCEVKVSYVEIYNEQVLDLFEKLRKLKVREHPQTGPYVENLSEFNVNDFGDFQRLLQRGNLNRATAHTQMNDESSRSHAIITVSLKQTKFKKEDDEDDDGEDDVSIGDADEVMISSIKLVDLAGSERLSKTKLYGQQERMKEGSLINKSLTVLGRCINLLSSGSSAPIPYRDSILTYILKENLGGNSKSFMIFCVLPLDFDETFQTLNYANQVKMIKTAARANKTKIKTKPIDWKELQKNEKDVIVSLKDEVKELTEQLTTLREHSPAVELKFLNLIGYLENETDKLKFENKYLKSQLKQQLGQLGELEKYVDYMDHEFNDLYLELEQSKLDARKGILAEKCERDLEGMTSVLYKFDPKRVF